jgi:DNA-binding NtrC family response regulator
MNIVVVGTLDQASANTLIARKAETDQITYLSGVGELASTGLAQQTIDMVLTGHSVDPQLVRAGLLEAGLEFPVFTSLPTQPYGQPTVPVPGECLSMVGSKGLRMGQKLADVERQLILQTLTHCGGNRTWAADILGISIRTLRNKLQQYSGEGLTVTSPGERRERGSSLKH